MKNISKRIVIYSLVGILQCGIGVSALEASPQHADYLIQQSSENQGHDRDKRLQEERNRHALEMKQHQHENEQTGRERRERENGRHNKTIETILGVAVISAILTAD